MGPPYTPNFSGQLAKKSVGFYNDSEFQKIVDLQRARTPQQRIKTSNNSHYLSSLTAALRLFI